MSTERLTTDVVIVGAGPTGLYGAYYAGFRGLSTIVVDVFPQVGGQVISMFPEKVIRDVAGIPSIRGRDFVDNLRVQADAYSPTYVLGRQAVALDYDEAVCPMLTLDDGTVISAGAIVLTAGIGTPTPRSLGVGDEWKDIALSYFVVDPSIHRGHDVMIVGGGDSALDWAETLAAIANSVTVVHRRAKFRGHAATLERLKTLDNTSILTECEIVSFEGDLDAKKLEKATIRHSSGTEQIFSVNHVIAALGFISNLGPLASWGLKLQGRSVEVDQAGHTNLPNIFAAGDLTQYEGKVKLMSVGFGEVATVMNHVAVALDPELTLFPGHSTDET